MIDTARGSVSMVARRWFDNIGPAPLDESEDSMVCVYLWGPTVTSTAIIDNATVRLC